MINMGLNETFMRGLRSLATFLNRDLYETFMRLKKQKNQLAPLDSEAYLMGVNQVQKSRQPLPSLLKVPV